MTWHLVLNRTSLENIQTCDVANVFGRFCTSWWYCGEASEASPASPPDAAVPFSNRPREPDGPDFNPVWDVLRQIHAECEAPERAMLFVLLGAGPRFAAWKAALHALPARPRMVTRDCATTYAASDSYCAAVVDGTLAHELSSLKNIRESIFELPGFVVILDAHPDHVDDAMIQSILNCTSSRVCCVLGWDYDTDFMAIGTSNLAEADLIAAFTRIATALNASCATRSEP
jgi:hypothetical protein